MIPPYTFLSRLLSNIAKVYPNVATSLDQFYHGRITKMLQQRIQAPQSSTRAEANRRTSLLEGTGGVSVPSPLTTSTTNLQQLYDAVVKYDETATQSMEHDITAAAIRNVKTGKQVEIFLEGLQTFMRSQSANGGTLPSAELLALIPPTREAERAHQLLSSTAG